MDKKVIVKWNLNEIMKLRELDIKETSEKCGLHRNIISRIKNNNQNRVDLETIERLINGLNVSPNELFKIEFPDN